jgi:alanyl-tRNA synthetase
VAFACRAGLKFSTSGHRQICVKTANDVRQQFIDFFVERGHAFVPSSPVAPLDDPTLLYTNAGMNQFKDVFLGTGKRPYTRAVNSQKCLRVSGKHNDLEEVGVDTYHHTFFEMLGNWSFGDYFKREAIGWSWELLTRRWGLPKERLWVTVFGGDEQDGLPADLETEDIWRKSTDIEPSHVLRFGRKANFWEMGETGPCGPCTEIHFDRGGPLENPRDGADPSRGVNAGNERFVELWNNVFMQFNRLESGSLRELPAKHVDTGMGFERVLGVLQGKRSNYDTDLFQPLFERLERLSGKRYGADEGVDVAFRVVADHVRALTSAIADGVLPSNEGRGYVLRRLLRRAARFGRQRLQLLRPFVCEMVPSVAEVLGGAFPEMRARAEHVALVVRSEEEAFNATLDRGLVVFEQSLAKSKGAAKRQLEGEAAFDLYATYGFPADLVALMLRERGWTLEQAGFDAAEHKHRAASRSEGKFKGVISGEQLTGLRPTVSTYHDDGPRAWFLERTRVEWAAEVAAAPGQKAETWAVVLESSPFYAESGGQIGDGGTIALKGDPNWQLELAEVKRDQGVVIHVGTLVSGTGRPGAGQIVEAKVDRERRERTRKNHTATHLLHKALKAVLGEHVAQQGSYVGPERLRFDFSHPKALAPEEQERIEALVNERVFRDDRVQTTIEPLEAAKARGAVAMFGEKYERDVRVLDVGGWSLELCGGTHVRAAGEIGPFVITLERAVAAGVRRIEAVTGPEAVRYVQEQRRKLWGASRALKTSPEELEARLEQLQSELKEARKKGTQAAKADLGAAFEKLAAQLQTRGTVKAAALDFPEFDAAGLGDLASRAKGAHPDLALVLFGREGAKAAVMAVCEGAALTRGLKAGELAGELAKLLGGGGGGRPNLAQGQGPRVENLPAALETARTRLEARLSG